MMFSVCYAICVLSDRLPYAVKAMISDQQVARYCNFLESRIFYLMCIVVYILSHGQI